MSAPPPYQTQGQYPQPGYGYQQPPNGGYVPSYQQEYPGGGYAYQQPPTQVVYVEKREPDTGAEECCLLGCCMALLCCCLVNN